MNEVDSAFTELERGVVYPVYLLAGEENEIKEEFIDKLIGVLNKKEDKGQGTVEKLVFFGDETDFSEIESELDTYSFFDSYKLIVVKKFEGIMNNPRFLQYIKNPAKKSVLVLKTDKRRDRVPKAVLKEVRNAGKAIMFWTEYYDQRAEKWLSGEFARRGIKADSEAVKYIVQKTGKEKDKLKSQVDIIESYLDEAGYLDVDMARSIISDISTKSIYDLLNALFFKKTSEIIEIYRSLLKNGEDISKTNNFIWQYFKKILIAKSYTDRGILKEKMNELTRIKAEAERISSIVNRITYRAIKAGIQRLSRIDFYIKTGKKLFAELQIERLLISLGRQG